jgi:tol-pal system protein YbgF
LKTGVLKKVFSLGIAMILANGCVNKKMMEFTYQELDTVKTTQRELLDRVDELTRQLEDEREARVRAEAEHALVLQELRDVLEALSFRVEDLPALVQARRQLYQQQPDTLIDPMRQGSTPAAGDTARLDAIVPPAAPSAGDSDAEKLFKGSYMDLTLGNYDLAVQGFKNYLVRFPNARSIVDAHYYLGDSYYQLQRFVEAVAEYQVVIREYGRSRFAPPALLKAGFCYEQLGEARLAERSFRELISQYPRSEEAEQARVALQDREDGSTGN